MFNDLPQLLSLICDRDIRNQGLLPVVQGTKPGSDLQRGQFCFLLICSLLYREYTFNNCQWCKRDRAGRKTERAREHSLELRIPGSPWLARSQGPPPTPALSERKACGVWITPWDHRNILSWPPSCRPPWPALRDFPKPILAVWLVTQNPCCCPRCHLWSASLEEKMFGTAGRGAPGLQPQGALLCVWEHRLFISLSSPRLCLFKAPLPLWCACPELQAGLVAAPGSRPSTYCTDHSSHGHRPQARNQGVQPGQWKGLGKSCYCVLGHPIIIVLAVMISVFIAISLSKSVPTSVLYRENFMTLCITCICNYLYAYLHGCIVYIYLCLYLTLRQDIFIHSLG